MRMTVMFAAVALLTGINLLSVPFHAVPTLWGAVLAVAFVLINFLADKLRLWSGVDYRCWHHHDCDAERDGSW